jgi:phosphohistidine phosphatase
MSAHTLVLLRHAKADNPPGLSDVERPLVQRGRIDAWAAGAWLGTRELRPQLVLCSPARRTRETWHGVAVALAESGTDAPEVRYEPRLYTGDARVLLDLLRTVPNEAGTVLVVGHNPTVSDASVLLDPDAGEVAALRTAALAVHAVQGSWAGLGSAELRERHTARAVLD